METRESLRILGDRLDEETNFTWLVDQVAKVQVAKDPSQSLWYVDAVRKKEQVAHFRSNFSCVHHVHFAASEEVLKDRFLARARDGDESDLPGAYEKHVEHPNEQAARSLVEIADAVLDLAAMSPEEAADAI